jgi:hypothetical protein
MRRLARLDHGPRPHRLTAGRTRPVVTTLKKVLAIVLHHSGQPRHCAPRQPGLTGCSAWRMPARLKKNSDNVASDALHHAMEYDDILAKVTVVASGDGHATLAKSRRNWWCWHSLFIHLAKRADLASAHCAGPRQCWQTRRTEWSPADGGSASLCSTYKTAKVYQYLEALPEELAAIVRASPGRVPQELPRRPRDKPTSTQTTAHASQT